MIPPIDPDDKINQWDAWGRDTWAMGLSVEEGLSNLLENGHLSTAKQRQAFIDGYDTIGIEYAESYAKRDPDDDPLIDIIDFIAPIIAIVIMFGCVIVYVLVVMR